MSEHLNIDQVGDREREQFEEVECSECDGSGLASAPGEDDDDCKRCLGTGYMFAPRLAATPLTLELPVEFLALCQRDGAAPEAVLRGFIADLAGIMNYADAPRADGYSSNGSDERRYAREYYERVGWPWMHREAE